MNTLKQRVQMYIETWKEKEEFWGAVCYRTESELIEAEGEAEALFLEQVVAEQYPSQYFQAIDWKTDEVIDLDIKSYVGQDAYDMFESSILCIDEDTELTLTKVESTWLAVLAHDARMRRRNR